MTCRDSLAQGGVCLVSRQGIFSLSPDVFVTEASDYLVAFTSFVEGSKRVADMKPEVTFLGVELAYSTERVRRMGDSIVSGEQGGLVTYGPRLDVPRGTYLIKVGYSAAEGSEVFFDVFSKRNPSIHVQYAPSPSESVFYCRVELEQPVPDLEIRTFLKGKGSLAVYGITIKKES